MFLLKKFLAKLRTLIKIIYKNKIVKPMLRPFVPIILKVIKLASYVRSGEIFNILYRKIAPKIRYVIDLLPKKFTSDLLDELSTYMDPLRKNLPEFSNNNGKQACLLHLCVWGDSYVNKMINYLVPSLLAPSNVPLITKNYNVYLWIHCDQTTKNKLEQADSVKKLGSVINIRYDVIPAKIYQKVYNVQDNFITKLFPHIFIQRWFKYRLLGGLQHVALLAAEKNKALISFMMPDFLFSDKTLSNMCLHLESGKKAVVGTAFRSSTTDLIKYLPKTNDSLILPGADLAKYAVETMHKAAQIRIASNKNTEYNLCPQIIFTYPNEVIVRAFQYHPLLVDFSKINVELKFDYNPIDNEMLNKIINLSEPLDEQICVIEHPEEMSFLEISDDEVELIMKRKHKKKISEQIAFYVNHNGWSKLNLFMASKRCTYKTSLPKHILISDISDNEVIDAMLELSTVGYK